MFSVSWVFFEVFLGFFTGIFFGKMFFFFWLVLEFCLGVFA